MIRSFGGGGTEDIFNGDNTKEARKLPRTIWKAAQRKLEHVDSAESLQDLAAVPGNRLEKLQGSRSEHHSIRINDQFRIVFRWEGENAFEVRIEDYH
ncbi:MAG: plasmid maintenance system killer protein [Elusimicrobia bacterium RIFCSPLOWO2_12_FULL_59_9]|nr:MAG: plasmid maintenance system killer protein [Elusimicrobia bacterium RIFCSPLOWO2_12_FULL_59_9]